MIRLCLWQPHARRDHLSEFEACHPLDDVLEILGIVVLAVDENNLLGATGDVQLALVDNTEVARAQPAVSRARHGIRLRILVVSLRDVLPADVNVPDLPVGKRTILIVSDANADSEESRCRLAINTTAFLSVGGHGLHALARAEAMTIERDGTSTACRRAGSSRPERLPRGHTPGTSRRAQAVPAPSGRGTLRTGPPKSAPRR